MFGGEFLGKPPQVVGQDFQLVLKNIVAEGVADRLRRRVEVAGYDGGLIRPVVHGQRKIVPDHGNLVGLAGLRDQRRGAAAVRALQVLEHHQRDHRTFRGAEGAGDFLRHGGQRKQKDEG